MLNIKTSNTTFTWFTMCPCPAPFKKLMAGAKLGRPAKNTVINTTIGHTTFTITFLRRTCGGGGVWGVRSNPLNEKYSTPK